MKKKVVKALSRYAQMLPVSYQLYIKGKVVPLSEVAQYKSDEFIGNNPDIDASTMVKQKITQVREINHLRKLKKAYRTNGINGIQDYTLWLDRNNMNMAPVLRGIDSRLNTKPIDQRLIEIAKMAPSKFWQALMMFIASFYYSFISGTNKDSKP